MHVFARPRLVNDGPPLAVLLLSRICGWSRQDQKLFYRALTAATWSAVSDWRARVLIFDALTPHTEERINVFIDTELRPATVIDLLEQLHAEGLVPRLDASRMQEALLAVARSDGAWDE